MSQPALSYAFAKAQGVIVTALGDVAEVARRKGSQPQALAEVHRRPAAGAARGGRCRL
jgi:general secretion pathway protein E